MKLWRLFPTKMTDDWEASPLLERKQNGAHRLRNNGVPKKGPPLGHSTSGLSLLFATLCIIDLFGVFPIVALPRPIIDCGWVGLPLAAGVFFMQIYTALLLGRCWVLAEVIDPSIIEKSRYPYAALAHMTMGQTMSKLVTVLLDVTIFGAGIPNLLVASQNIQLFGLKMSDNRFDVSFCYWLIIVGIALCPIMWLGSPKDMKALAVASVCTVVSVAALTWTCMIQDESLPPGFSPIVTPPSWEALAIAYGIIAFQFDVHPMILTVQVDMQHKNKLGKAILASFMVTGVLFLTTAAIALWKYGPALRYNVLQGLPGSVPLYVNVLLVTVQICLSMVVGGSALFQDVEDKLSIPASFSWKRVVLRSCLVLVSVFIAEAVPRFDLVMGLIGGSLTGPLMFILPPLFYAKLRVMLSSRQLSTRGYTNRVANKMSPPTFADTDATHLIRDPPSPHENIDQDVSSEVEKALLRKMLSTEQYPNDYVSYHDQFLQSSSGNFQRNKSWMRWTLDLDFLSLESSLDAGPLSFRERTLTVVIVVMGTAATLAATFFSIRDTLRYATFTPPCLVNVTQASKILSILNN